jgi:hypothetical protein
MLSTAFQLAFAQSAESVAVPLRLRVQVLGVEVEEISPHTYVAPVNVKLRLEFLNVGRKPVILLTDHAPLCPRAMLTRDAESASGGNLLFDQYAGPADQSRSPEWTEFRKALDQQSPPSALVRILQPGERWVTESFSVLRPPIKFENYRVDRPPVSWQILKEASPVWLRLECDTWPRNVERPPLDGRFRLGSKLRKRWKRSGELQLDSVESEPVKLDLREGIQVDQHR